jgi:undecaprenyl-diphosphatase
LLKITAAWQRQVVVNNLSADGAIKMGSNMNPWHNIINHVAIWDQAIQQYVIAGCQPEAVLFFVGITRLGNSTTLIMLCALLTLWLLARKNWSSALVLDMGLTSAWLTMAELKNLFGRIRPPGEQLVYAGGHSFPSGHAMLSVVFYGFAAYLFTRNLSRKGKIVIWGIISVLLLLIGISRVYLNVHYASDVMGGYFLGCCYLGIMISLDHKLTQG